ncbi:MAG: lytic transglycosylase domain-containing protein [Pseudolabrys sp.]
MVVKKSSVGPANETQGDSAKSETPAETTDQLMTQSGESPGSDSENPQTAEEPEVAQAPVPMPPRRAIPHSLVCEELALAAVDNDLPAPFLIKLINQESHFNQNAVSRVGAQGVAQFMPGTAAQMRLDDPFNPLKSVHASAQLLRNLLEQFGNRLGLAAAAYNAGPKRVQDWLAKKNTLPKETRDYVERITGRKAEEWKVKEVAAKFRVPAHAPCQRQAGLFASNGPQAIPLPPLHPGSEPVVKVAAALAKKASHKVAAAKNVTVASADIETLVITVKPEKPKHGANAPQAVKTKTKAATVTVAAKSTAKHVGKLHKAKAVQVAEARASHK